MATEEQRAVTYRAQMVARAEARRERCEALAGSSVARAALIAAWRPVILAQAERGLTDEVGIDELGPCAGLLGN